MEIVWSKLAYEHFLEILIYVENNFGMLTAQKTRQKIQDKVNLLAKHPYIGIIDSDFSTLFNNITVRHLKLSPNVIYYLIDGIGLSLQQCFIQNNLRKLYAKQSQNF